MWATTATDSPAKPSARRNGSDRPTLRLRQARDELQPPDGCAKPERRSSRPAASALTTSRLRPLHELPAESSRKHISTVRRASPTRPNAHGRDLEFGRGLPVVRDGHAIARWDRGIADSVAGQEVIGPAVLAVIAVIYGASGAVESQAVCSTNAPGILDQSVKS